MKDAVSLPEVSMHYLLRGWIECRAKLYSPCKEDYDMLKEAVVGGESLVFKRHHKVGMIKIWLHHFRKSKACKQIIGYTLCEQC